MKKLFLTLIFAIGMIGMSFAQSFDDIDFKDIKGDYIILDVNGWASKGETKFRIYYGDALHDIKVKRTIVKDSLGEIVKSTSSVAILNFLNENGYELTSFTIDRVGSALGFTYLMKRTK